MGKFNIEYYLNSLPKNTTKIDISCKGVTYLPDITRFTSLEVLDCDDNYLTSLPPLPESLLYLSCERNKLRYLPLLPENLQYLYCSYNLLTCLPPLPASLLYLYCMKNMLTSLPPLPASLLHLYCTGNKLTYLSAFPANLQNLFCGHNQLTCLHMLPENLNGLCLDFNPIYQIINNNNWKIIRQKLKIINSFRHLYYSLKFKKQFRFLLWEKVRKHKIETKYNPNNLIKILNEDIDLDKFLINWTNDVN